VSRLKQRCFRVETAESASFVGIEELSETQFSDLQTVAKKEANITSEQVRKMAEMQTNLSSAIPKS